MSDPEKTSNNRTDNVSAADGATDSELKIPKLEDPELEAIADRYLSLWQDNIKYWSIKPPEQDR